MYRVWSSSASPSEVLWRIFRLNNDWPNDLELDHWPFDLGHASPVSCHHGWFTWLPQSIYGMHIGILWMWCCGHGQSSTFRSLRWLVLPDVYASKMTGVLRAHNQLCRQRHLVWGYRSRTGTLTLTLKLTLTLTLFLTLTRTFFFWKKNKKKLEYRPT